MSLLNITDSAINKIKDLILEEGENSVYGLRIFVTGGGCSGLQYEFTFEENKNDDDFELDFDGVKILVDSLSNQYLAGAKLDYTENLEGSNFVIDNPNAVRTCGCGSSFEV